MRWRKILGMHKGNTVLLWLLGLSLLLPYSHPSEDYAVAKSSGSIAWSRGVVNETLQVGETKGIFVVLSSTIKLTGASLWITPELQPFVRSLEPASFANLEIGKTYSVKINLCIPTNTQPGSYDGTIHLRVGSRTYPEILKLKLNITASHNIQPIANAGPDQSVFVGAMVTLNGAGSSDADGDPLTYRWSFTARPSGSGAVLSDATAVNPKFTVDRPGDYVVQLIVNDPLVSSMPATVRISTQNSAPVAEAGPSQTTVVTAMVHLDGSGSNDVDGDTLSYQWSFSSRPPGSATTLSDPLAVNPTFVVDVFGTYVVQLFVNDGMLPSLPDTVTVSTENSRPVARAGWNQTIIHVNDLVTLDGSHSTDVDGDSLTYQWSFTARPPGSAATLSDPTAVKPTFVPDVFGTYVIQLIVNDGKVNSAPDTVTISTENSPPVANAGPNQTPFVGETVQLDGSKSSDVDGNLLTFLWSFQSKPAESASTLSSTTAVMPSFLVDDFGVYVVQLIVNDGAANSAPSTVSISTLNSLPVANAGPDQTVLKKILVTLDGSGSHDADDNPLTYNWSLISRPAGSTAALSNPTTLHPTFVPDLSGDYIVQLIVNDGTVDSTPDTVVITTLNSRPVADAGPPQSPFVFDRVTLDGSGSNDADHDPLTYSWSLTVVPIGSTAVLAGPATVRPTFVPDLDGAYVVQLIVNDGTVDSSPDTVSITAQFRMVTVPLVVDNTQADAEAAILSASLRVGSVTTQESPTVPAGNVISQNPSAGALVPQGTAVNLVISAGPHRVAVPDLSGMSQSGAQSALTSAGLSVGAISTQDSNTVAAGNVISQDPSAGSLVPEGTAVSLLISLGSTLTTVPDVTGLSQSAAMQAIVSVNLTVGTIGSSHSQTILAGYVLSQSVPAGTHVNPGSSVGLTVSSGPETGGLPPDPSVVAPPPQPGVSTSLYSSTSFLYAGPVPVQTGVAAGIIELKRAAVIRGKVLTREGNPLTGVNISILNHPEFGQTLTRADGMFDMAVNGGEHLTVNYELMDYLGLQRQVEVPWQDYVFVPDVRMIPVDPNVTFVDLSSASEFQVVSGSIKTDGRGTREERLLIPKGTQAWLVMPDGSEQPVSSLTVRVTEFTVGTEGVEAMPAELPPTVAYT